MEIWLKKGGNEMKWQMPQKAYDLQVIDDIFINYNIVEQSYLV